MVCPRAVLRISLDGGPEGNGDPGEAEWSPGSLGPWPKDGERDREW